LSYSKSKKINELIIAFTEIFCKTLQDNTGISQLKTITQAVIGSLQSSVGSPQSAVGSLPVPEWNDSHPAMPS
jgi:hypothetical protein